MYIYICIYVCIYIYSYIIKNPKGYQMLWEVFLPAAHLMDLIPSLRNMAFSGTSPEI